MKIKDEKILKEMAVIGEISFKRDMNVDVSVYRREGENIPHLHLDCGDSFSCCIRLEVPEYFIHGGHQDILNSKQRKQFDRYMRSTPDKPGARKRFETNWHLAVFLWNQLPNALPVDEDQPIPDYRKLIVNDS